jgi:threonylcarbamoyladenosine tRNA methylthiotransferase MtaB
MMNGGYRTFYIATLGCKVNQYESDLLRRQCVETGLAESREPALADIIIVNTCGVTGSAVGKSRRAVRALRRKSPGAALVATGCAVNLDRGDFEMDGVRLVPHEKKNELLNGLVAGGAGAKLPACTRTRALLKVQDGCNQFCAYCVVPHVRSEMWSKPFDEAVAEARYLAGQGHREIVVTGVRLGLYDDSGMTLADLLAALDDIEGLDRVRFSSLEIGEIDGALLNAMARSRAFCRHLHLPLQSGDDAILARMKRPYSAGEYLSRLKEIRSALGRVAITTDVIVGFPGETDAQFDNTMRVCREAGFSKMHIFPFSARRPAPAAEMPDAVPPAVIRRRANALAALERELAAEYRKPMLGDVVEILVEARAGRWLKGKTRDYITVEFEASESLLHEIACVRVNHLEGLRVRGVLAESVKDNQCRSRSRYTRLSQNPM